MTLDGPAHVIDQFRARRHEDVPRLGHRQILLRFGTAMLHRREKLDVRSPKASQQLRVVAVRLVVALAEISCTRRGLATVT
jgi:hypothetical protein